MGNKGKGRQAGGFATKAQKAQFQGEWQAKYNEEATRRRKQQQQLRREVRKRNDTTIRPTFRGGGGQLGRPKIQQSLVSLQRLLHNRHSDDRFADRTLHQRAIQQRKEQRQHCYCLSKAGVVVYYHNNNNNNNNHPNGIVVDDDVARVPQRYGEDFRCLTRRTTHDSIAAANTKDPHPIPALQALCIRALAPVLIDYLHVFGRDQLHSYLSALPGPALTELSVLVSSQSTNNTTNTTPPTSLLPPQTEETDNSSAVAHYHQSEEINGSGEGMTSDLVYVLGHHAHVTRISIVAPRNNDDQLDPSWNRISNAAIKRLIPTFGHQDQSIFDAESTRRSCRSLVEQQSATVPESWEDYFVKEDHTPPDAGGKSEEMDVERERSPVVASSAAVCGRIDDSMLNLRWYGFIKCERLELGNLPYLSYGVLADLLQTCGGLTHVGLSGSLNYDTGPKILCRLYEWLPQLHFLDVSGNHWVTEILLRNLYHQYNGHGNDDQHFPHEGPTISTTSHGSKEQQHKKTRRKRPHYLSIRAAGCLTPSSQILLATEYNF